MALRKRLRKRLKLMEAVDDMGEYGCNGGWKERLEAGFDPGSKLDQRTKEIKGRRSQRSKLDSVLQWRLWSSTMGAFSSM